MSSPVFPPRLLPDLPVTDGRRYAVARIFCVGRNYAAHAAEMGSSVTEAPFWFTKSPFALIPSGATLPYPPGTTDLHHEVELVLALGAPLFLATPAQARAAIWGMAVGLDMTRRDLQAAAKAAGLPWDAAKDFDGAAVIGPLTPGAAEAGLRLRLTVNGNLRQDAAVSDMLRGVEALLQHLSTLYRLGPGDLVMTGTPAGVGPVVPGDALRGEGTGLAPVAVQIGPAAGAAPP
jgi:fumarylpyruvate hydrolase